jgi:N-acetylneuraminate synthase
MRREKEHMVMLRDRKVADFTTPYIIAEVNSSHNGKPDIARKMIEAAAQAGCDCVKFQSWSTNTLYSKTYYKQNPIAKRFVDRLGLKPETLKEMAAYCRELGVEFSSTPYSFEEVDYLVDECRAPFVKISSMEVNNAEFLRYIAAKNVPIVLSTGMSDMDEIKQAVSVIEDAGNSDIVILHCVSVYPTPIEAVNLNNIVGLRKAFPSHPIGFSDHTIGDAAAAAATVLGAAVIEKHITLDAERIGMDNQMAMEADEFKIFVQKCKTVGQALGSEERHLSKEEKDKRSDMRRSLVTTRDIEAGEVLERSDLTAKRPGTGIPPTELESVVGCRTTQSLEADTVITWDALDKNFKD